MSCVVNNQELIRSIMVSKQLRNCMIESSLRLLRGVEFYLRSYREPKPALEDIFQVSDLCDLSELATGYMKCYSICGGWCCHGTTDLAVMTVLESTKGVNLGIPANDADSCLIIARRYVQLVLDRVFKPGLSLSLFLLLLVSPHSFFASFLDAYRVGCPAGISHFMDGPTSRRQLNRWRHHRRLP